jgi:anthranilate phosphoribosyltransferase
MLKAYIQKLMRGEDLDQVSCQNAVDAMLNPTTNPAQISAFLVLLRSKGETSDELSAFAKALRAKMILVPTHHVMLDIVGTGGDGFNTVNISTGSALLAASCGVKVAKHGNRAVTSLAGSADVLEALGVNIKQTPEQIAKSIDQIGIGFCYFPDFHPVTSAISNIRKQLNVATTFNILGPLLNPAGASHFILGVADAACLATMADTLRKLNCSKSVIVHGLGMDEITCAGSTKIIEINKLKTAEFVINPKQFNLELCKIDDLRGNDADTNAELLLDVFKGKRNPIADSLILNAAVALYIYGLYSSIADAISHAYHNLACGAVLTLLNHWIELTNDQ